MKAFASSPSTSPAAFQIRFRSLFDSGRALAFPCDANGQVHLDDLLAACAAVLEPDGFMLLTAHTPNYGPDRLGSALVAAARRPTARIETGDLGLTTADGRTLELGGFARAPGGA